MLPNFGYGCQIMPTDVKNKVYRKCQQTDPTLDPQGLLTEIFMISFLSKTIKKIIRNNFHWKIISIYENYIIVLFFFYDFITAMWEGKNFQKTQ